MRAKITNNLLKRLKSTGKGYDVNDPDLPGFALRVSGDGKPTSYSIRYRTPGGRRQRLKIGSARILTPRQARDLAQEALADATKGEDPQTVKKHLKGIQTLGRFIEEQYAPHELANQKTGAITLKRLKTHFGKFWNRPLVDRRWTEDILTWRAKRLEEGKTPSTCNRDIASLRAVFSHAVRLDVLTENPLKAIRQFKLDTTSKVRYLLPDEEQRLMAALDDRDEKMKDGRASANEWREKYSYEKLPELRDGTFADHLKPMILISLHTGVRRGELFSFEWPDVDFDNAVLTIRGETTKSSKTRHLPLNATALSTLKDWRAQTPDRGLIFVSPQTGSRFDNVDAAWGNLLEDAEIDGFRWHDLRHDFASKLVMGGVDLNTVRELLGHGDIKMTLRYAHLAPEHKASAVKVLDRGKP